MTKYHFSPLLQRSTRQPKRSFGTIFLASLSLVLAAVTGIVLWQLRQPAPAKVINDQPAAGGATVAGISKTASSPLPEPTDEPSLLVYDTKAQSVVLKQNAFSPRPIASITKLMTAMVALDYGIPWQTQATINPDEYGPGGNLQLHAGEHVTMRDLFNASLVGSANNATLAYVRELGVSEDEFIQAMNRKAVELGLEQTKFVEVTGLDPDNVSTAYEVAVMANAAFSQYPDISAATSRPEYTFTIAGSGRNHTIKNTNKLVAIDGKDVIGSKTGYLDEARYSLVMQEAGTVASRLAVVLGVSSEQEQWDVIEKIIHEQV